MSKRRRSVTSNDARDDEQPAPIPIKKRKRSVTQVVDQSDICQELYETIRNYKDEDGRLLCESFVRVPKRRSLPEYYDVVTAPIDLLKIQQKLKLDEYETIDQLTVDIELIVNNSKAYYPKESQEYHDACDLMDLYIETKNEILEENEDLGCDLLDREEEKAASEPDTMVFPTVGLSGDESDEESEGSIGLQREEVSNFNFDSSDSDYAMDNPDNPFEQLFTAVMTHKDSTGRYTSLLFRKLPARASYPEYYDFINHPIDLKTIAKKIKNDEYSTLHDAEKDLLLMVKNAKTFNEPGSNVYKDACTLKKIITVKKNELERLVKDVKDEQTPFKISERIKARQSSGQNTLSAITAALQISSDEDEDPQKFLPARVTEWEEGDESGTDFLMDIGDPLHVLFHSVISYRNAMAQLVCEPFMRLPNSRAYPDYYREIEQPLALSKIRSKVKSAKYENLNELAEDLNLVFNNAKKYNLPNSRLFKDADRLQKLMLSKKKELEKIEVKKENGSVHEEEITDKPKKKKVPTATLR